MQQEQQKLCEKIECIGCQVVLQRDHIGIKCPQGHDICTQCVSQFLSQIMENPEANLPAKCMLCKLEILPISFERQLDPDALQIYLLYSAIKEIPKDDIIQSCPFCKYYIISPKSHSMNFFYCQKDSCSKPSCSVCKKELPQVENDYEFSEDQMDMIEDSWEPHFNCWEYKELKQRFDSVMDKGSKMFCPSCNLGGMKDNACTHMICDSCDTTWCYFCGKAEKDCDRDGNENIYSHNTDFEFKQERCPMYFYNIQDIDGRWPQSDQECLDFFHRKKTIGLLREFIQKEGKDMYQKLVEIFASCGDASGYTLDTIENEDTTLIYRIDQDSSDSN